LYDFVFVPGHHPKFKTYTNQFPCHIANPFDSVKATIAKEVVLAYLDFTKPFDMYTDISTKQIGAVITQDNRPIAFVSQKLSYVQS
jgi:hypothetical protein